MKSDFVGLNLPRAKGAYRVRSTYRSPPANIESEGHIDARSVGSDSVGVRGSSFYLFTFRYYLLLRLCLLLIHRKRSPFSRRRRLLLGLSSPRAKAHIECEAHIDRPRRISSPKDISTREAPLPTPSGCQLSTVHLRHRLSVSFCRQRVVVERFNE